VVDTGVYEYTAGRLRDLSRSTVAHNSPTIDDFDQAECWSSFRVARRFPPKDVSFDRGDDEIVLRASFDGYKTLLGDALSVHREIRMVQGEKLVVVDTFQGLCRHKVASRLHLHPRVLVSDSESRCVTLSQGSQLSSSERLYLESSPFFPRFGECQTRRTLVLHHTGELPRELRYDIVF